jgi:cytochrome c peroxidase
MRLAMALAVVAAWSAGAVLIGGGRFPLGLDLYRPVPPDNALTPERIALGRRLFNDRRLSRNGDMSCATCHEPARAFASPRLGASLVAGRVLARSVPTIVNRAWGASFFWDGRAASLEEQVLQPLFNPRELASTPATLLAITRDVPYQSLFVEAFGSHANIDHVAMALAAYLRTIVCGNSPVDRYLAGDVRALGRSARRGFALFGGRAGCAGCHAGPTFTDERYHDTGVAWRDGVLADEGRALVTREPADRGAFKTPTLRQVGMTAPYMHDGSLATLEAVVDFYNRGGHPNPSLDSRIRPLDLSPQNKADLVAFLQALTGEVREVP